MRTKQTIIYAAFLLIFVSFANAQTPSGTPPPPPPLIIESDEVIRIDSRLVIVPVSVTDGNGMPVRGLGPEHFIIRENSRIQKVFEVSDADKAPLEIAILFDISGSTDPMFKFEQETAAKFLQDVMRPEDRATIFTIGASPVLLQTRNVAFQSIETIKGLQPTKQYTAFYDTVMAAAIYLQQNADPKSRKVVIAITDGEDTNSEGVKRGFAQVYTELGKRINTITTKELKELLTEKRNAIRVKEQDRTLQKLQNADTVFYSVNPAGSSFQLNKMSQFGQENMERFAVETGGTAFLPKFLPIDLKSSYENNSNLSRNTDTLTKIFLQVRNELQAQYLVQYYSDGEFDDNQYVNVELKVQLALPQGMNVRSRKGYFVKKQ